MIDLTRPLRSNCGVAVTVAAVSDGRRTRIVVYPMVITVARMR